MAEEEVHGGVESGTEPDNQGHAQVPQHSDRVDGEEDQEEWQLETWIFREAQESESDAITLVFFSAVEKDEC